MSRSRGMWSLAAAAVIGFFATPPQLQRNRRTLRPILSIFPRVAMR
jgi:hypothetical protein